MLSGHSRRSYVNESDDLSSELGELVNTIARRLRRSSKQRLSTLGISFSQARVLRILARTSDPMRMSQIAREIEVVPRSATTLVEGLEERGLVRREIDPADRRSVIVILTDSAQGLLSDLAEARSEASTLLFANLSEKDKRALHQILQSVASLTTESPPLSKRDQARQFEGGAKP